MSADWWPAMSTSAITQPVTAAANWRCRCSAAHFPAAHTIVGQPTAATVAITNIATDTNTLT